MNFIIMGKLYRFLVMISFKFVVNLFEISNVCNEIILMIKLIKFFGNEIRFCCCNGNISL